MNNKTIIMFLATYENRSISKAARGLFFSKQTISKSLKALEDELGVKLFMKARDGFEPTEECHKLYPIIKELKEDIDVIEKIYEVKNNPYSIRIADNNVESITKYYNMALEKYYDKDVLYSYENTDTKEIFDMLMSKKCDIGIFTIPKDMEADIRKMCKSNDIELELLWEGEPSIVVSDTHPLAEYTEVTAKDLINFKRLDLVKSNPEEWFFTKYLEANKINTKADIETNAVANVITSLKDIDYYFISVYVNSDKRFLKGLKIIPFKDTGLDILILLGYNKDHLYNDMAKYFMDLVRKHYRGEEIED